MKIKLEQFVSLDRCCSTVGHKLNLKLSCFSSSLPRLPPLSHLLANTSSIFPTFLHELCSLRRSVSWRCPTSANPIKTFCRLLCFSPLSHLLANTSRIIPTFLLELSSLRRSVTWRLSTATNPVGLLSWSVVQGWSKSNVDQKQQQEAGFHHLQV